MATQTAVVPDDQQGAANLALVRQGSHAGAERLQPRSKLRTNHGCLHDSERIIGICAAVKIVLDFIRAAKLGNAALPVWEGAEHLETRAALESAVENLELLREQLYRENLVLRDEVDRVSMFEEIVGTSPALQAALSRVAKVAATDSTVLITGETGTGKELVARATHRRSSRASRAFVSVNCAAIPRDLIASELFGHEKGAFTGAIQQRLGRFELANGGTLFLDEVGDLPAETQFALLRVLQEHEFERVGGTRPIRADVRVIAATNRDLQAAISAGSFRSDLFYRLHVFPIEIPALRERKQDIRLLVEYFIDRYARKAGKRITTVDKKTLRLLESYDWPGNIRELQNVIERSVLLCETESFSIDESWLPQQPSPTEENNQIRLPLKLVAQEKSMIEGALKESGGRVSGPRGAAAKLGIPRSTLESRIRSLKIDKNRFTTQLETRNDRNGICGEAQHS
jgi:transcriptional regulator with GAF, ATPase, and Fis domain